MVKKKIKGTIKKGNIFPFASDKIGVTIVFWVMLFGIIGFTDVSGLRNAYGAINPVIMFLVGVLSFITIGVRKANTFEELKKSLGFESPIPFFGILLFLNGIGLGTALYAVFTHSLMDIFSGTLAASLAQPFYNPYTASATAFIGNLSQQFIQDYSIIAFNLVVAISEETYKIGIYKNLSNWLHKKTNLDISYVMAISLVISILLWTLWHFFAWHFTIISLFTGLMYGLMFYGGYFILASTGVFPAKGVGNNKIAMTLSGLVIYPSIGAHWAWDVGVSTTGFGLGLPVMVTVGGSLFIITAAIMVPARNIWG